MNKIFSMVGLATRAGKTVAGEFSVEKAVRTGKAFLVLVSHEASDNVNIIRFRYLYMEVKKSWEIPREMENVLQLRLWMKVLVEQS